MKASVLMMVLAMCFVGAMVLAADEALTGKVSVTKGDDGKVTAIKLAVGEVTYNVNLEGKGMGLAELDKKVAKVTGTVAEKDGAKWITVTAFEAVKRERKEKK
jgi:phage gp16-like protein